MCELRSSGRDCSMPGRPRSCRDLGPGCRRRWLVPALVAAQGFWEDLPWLGREQSGHDSVAAQPTRGCWRRADGADLRGRSDLRRGRLHHPALSLQPRPCCGIHRGWDQQQATRTRNATPDLPGLDGQGPSSSPRTRRLPGPSGPRPRAIRQTKPRSLTVGHVTAGAVTRTPLLQVGGNTTGTDRAAGSIPALSPAGPGAVAAVPPHRSPRCQPGDRRADREGIR
jgi:hypothetical protein